MICKSVKVDNDNINGDLSEQFNEWEEEEKIIARTEQVTQIKELQRDLEGGETLPQYMLDLLDEFGFKDLNDEPIPASKLPTIAVIGRPNTGKSTLVNKITNSHKDGAIVHDEPGITRDRTYRIGQFIDYNFQVVDTGGIIFDDTNDIFAERITQQALIALKEASVAIVVCDGREGLTQLDEILVQWLRRNNKVPVYIAVSKCESEVQGIAQAQEFWSLGMGAPFPVSGIHGTGIMPLLQQCVTHMPKVTNVLPENATNVALVGRPNVGKSSLLNRLCGKERSIVSDVAGTTRDTVDELVKRNKNELYRLIDTAGIRKRGKVQYGPEFFMVNRAFKAIRRSDVVVLMLDAISGIVEQDRILADRIAKEGRACIIALNKWDAVPNKDDKSYLAAVDNIRSNLPVLRWADVVLISATEGQRTEKLFEMIRHSQTQFRRRISTGILNEVVNDATLWMAPPTIGARAGRIYYCIQISTAPPTLVFFVNDPSLFTENYQRYMERKIRDSLNFEGTPIKMVWRGKSLRAVARSAKRGEVGKVASNVLGGGSGEDGNIVKKGKKMMENPQTAGSSSRPRRVVVSKP